VCTQEISADFRDGVIARRSEQVGVTETGLEQLMADYNKTHAQLDEILKVRAQIVEIDMTIFRTNSGIQGLEKYQHDLEVEISKIVTEHASREDTKISDLEDQRLTINSNYAMLQEQKQTYMTAAALLKDGGIKSKIIKQYIPIINKLINKYLSALDFFVQFELDEDFNETIKVEMESCCKAS